MRSLKSGLFTIAAASVLGTMMAAIGCSADGSAGDFVQETEPTEAKLPPKGENPPSTDRPNENGGGKDASVDTYVPPPPPEPGDPCTTLDEKFSKQCGKCGKQETICQATGDGGALVWQPYGPCTGEMGLCTPGTTEACGNCGTRTCTYTCNWGACGGEPPNSCSPGAIEYTQAGCTTPTTYKNKTCGSNCQWGQFSATCAEPNNPNKMTLSATVGGVVSQQWALTSANVGKSPSSCTSTASFTNNVQYVAVEVRNPTNQTAKISLYHSKAPSGSEIDTEIWVYKSILPPYNDATLRACDWGVNDSCSVTGTPCGNTTSYNFAGVENVLVPPQGKVLVYSAGYSSTVTGPFMLNVRTDAFQ